MKILDGIIEGSFKRGEDGTETFYPWGVLGKGYILPDRQKGQEVRAFLRRYLLIGLAAAVVLSLAAFTIMVYVNLAAGAALWVALLAAAVAGGEWVARRLTRGLPASQRRMALGEASRRTASAMSLARLWILEGLALLLTAASAWMVYYFLTDERSPWYIGSLGAFGVLIFLAAGILFAWMIVLRSNKGNKM